jgi:hypothetical protein
MKFTLIPVLALLLSTSLFGAPERSKGISMHMLPERVAKISGKQGGFTVSYAPYLAPEKKEPLLQTLKEFKAFIAKQKSEVKENGVWIVTTNPVSYSEAEKELLEQVTTSLPGIEVPIFVCRGSELPDGWTQTNK